MSRHKIILVDDHKLFRDGLKLLLNNNPATEVVAEASNGQEFLDLMDAYPDSIVLMDIDMPVLNGEETTRMALQRNPDMRIIALSMFGENEFYFKMIEAGVKGFLLKNSEITEVLNAIETVAHGENCFSQELLYSIVRNLKGSNLMNEKTDEISEREAQILQLICEGLNNQEIGDKLFISKRTVDKHRANILEKTGCKNTASLVMYAIRKGIIKV